MKENGQVVDSMQIPDVSQNLNHLATFLTASVRQPDSNLFEWGPPIGAVLVTFIYIFWGVLSRKNIFLGLY